MKKNFLTILLPVLPLLLTFWLYFPVLKGHFNWEDGMILGDAVQVLTKGKFYYLFSPWYGDYARFFLQIASVILFKFFGYNSTAFLATGLFLHLTNVLLVYFLALKLTSSKLIAFFSSIFYGVYQINYEGLTWVFSGLKDVPMTTFFLTSFLSFLSYLQKKKPIYLIWCYCFFALSLSSEFKALFIPFVFLTYELIFLSKKLLSRSTLLLLAKYLPFLLIEIIFVKFWYITTPSLFYGAKDWSAFLTFIASLPFYLLPISRIFWTKVYTNAHGLTVGHSDELYLKELGAFIFICLLIAIISQIFLKRKKEAKILIFLIFGSFFTYLPVIFAVLSKYHTLWAVLTVHWRYFTLTSSLASILIVSSIIWTSNGIYDILNFNKNKYKLITFPIKLLPIFLFIILISFYITYDRKVLKEYYLSWTVPAKNLFSSLKKNHPFFPKESILIIEGTNDESKYPFYRHRYLLENIFPLYANPNNQNYLTQEQQIPVNAKEGYFRPLDRLLFYTNLKDILVGKHQHLYQNGNSKMIASNIPIGLPAVDRLFLGTIYGLYNPEKIYDFVVDEKGGLSEITTERRKQLTSFIKYFCFENGIKTCQVSKYKNLPEDINKILGLFSNEGKTIIENLMYLPKGNLPYPYRTDI